MDDLFVLDAPLGEDPKSSGVGRVAPLCALDETLVKAWVQVKVGLNSACEGRAVDTSAWRY